MVKKCKKSGYEQIVKYFKTLTKNPDLFLSLQQDEAEKVKEDLIKNLYDDTKKNDGGPNKSLSELIVADGMDAEQIWQQLELQNEEIIHKSLKATSRLAVANTDKYKLSLGEESEQEEEEVVEGEEEEEALNDVESDAHESEEALSDNDESNIKTKSLKLKKNYKKSIVDDQFFKLGEMEEFLEQEERREMEGGSADDTQIDYFAEEMSESDSEEDLKYSQFFDAEDGSAPAESDQGSDQEYEDAESEQLENNNDENLEENPYLNDSEDNQQSGESDNDLMPPPLSKKPINTEADKEWDEMRTKLLRMAGKHDNDEEEIEPEPIKSSFEQRQDKLKVRIEKMENQILDDRPWQLKGEVQGDKRPQNSLLEEILEVDMATRPAPIITEETTLRLEDIIKQRIKDKAFDDVERKIKPTDIQYEFKKKLVLDQEKSKESLAQVYEKEYLKELEKVTDPHAKEDAEEEEPKEHQEIRSLMKDLFSKLDTLSNFFYTPKPATSELKIITNLPTISMEEVAPVATSEAMQLAPEEIKRRNKGEVLGKGERTKTDKNRERRKKKVFQKEKQIREDKYAEKGAKFQSKLEQKKLVDKVTKNRNVEKMKESTDDKSIKSSSAFFSKLQDEVSVSMGKQKSNKTKGSKRLADNATMNAKRVKL